MQGATYQCLINKCLSFFKMMRKNTSIFWNKDCDRAFQGIKQHVNKPPILINPFLGETLYLYLVVAPQTYAVLLTERNKVQHPIYYIIQILTNTQNRYLYNRQVGLHPKDDGTKAQTLLQLPYSGCTHLAVA